VSSLEEVAGLRACLKWPNDILVADRKLCGILCELITKRNRIMGVVIGVGVNLNIKMAELPGEVRPSATTVLHEVGHKVSIEHLAGQLISEIDRRLMTVRERDSFYEVLDEWKRHNCILGRRVRVEDDSGSFTGVAIDLTAEGGLVVRKIDGTETVVTAGDVALL
jgi:BirA family biotin operon repressor/biotin-[acetyl-CoA-carboxylase] ligase